MITASYVGGTSPAGVSSPATNRAKRRFCSIVATGFEIGERAREVEGWEVERGALEEWSKAQGLRPLGSGEKVVELEWPAEEGPGAAKE